MTQPAPVVFLFDVDNTLLDNDRIAADRFIGFAVGRTTFWEPVVNWRADRISREAAVAEIARRYREWVNVFEAARRS